MAGLPPKPSVGTGGTVIPSQRLAVTTSSVTSFVTAFSPSSNLVVMEVQTGNVIATFDGTAPSATNGVNLWASQNYSWNLATAQNAKFIGASGSAAIVAQEFQIVTGSDTMPDGAIIKTPPVGSVSSGGGGSGTVTSVSVTTANGVSGTVANSTTTPAISLLLGAITPTSVNGIVNTALSAGFSIAGGTSSKTLTVSNTITLAGADSSMLNIGGGGTLGSNAFNSTVYAPLASPAITGTPTAPTASAGTNTTQIATTAFVLANAGSTGANPTASIGTSAVNGSATTFMRSDGAPALDQTAAWNFSHSTGVPIHGTNTNDAASAGYVGEYVTASAARNVFSFSSGSVSNVVSISLTAGDWLVSGNTLFTVLSGTELVTRAQCGISTTSVTLPSQVSPSYWAMAYLLSPDQDFTGNGMTRVSLASTTTVYLVAQINWSGGAGIGGGGSIQAWRIR